MGICLKCNGDVLHISYKLFNILRINLSNSAIKYIDNFQTINIDNSSHQISHIDSLLNEYNTLLINNNFVILFNHYLHLFTKYLHVIDILNLNGIYQFVNIYDNKGYIVYDNSKQIYNSIILVEKFLNPSHVNLYTLLKNKLEYSFKHKKNIYIS
jgi:hypothetical protein